MTLRVPDGVTLYFCRHGETEANAAGRFQGRTLDTPLTPKGLAQARALADLLQSEADDVTALVFVSSPLPRAIATMDIVLGELKLPEDYLIDPRLAEIDLGAWDGLTKREARARDPKAFDAREADKWNLPVPGGGETYADVAARASAFVRELERDCFAVSHGAFIRILRGLFEDLGANEMSALDEKQGVLFRARGGRVARFEADGI